MMNTHFLYLLGHLRLLEEQHSLVSLNRNGIGLIGTIAYNLRYSQAINHSQHHCELKSVCHIDPPLPSAAYFMCQKKKIEEVVNNEEIDSIIITSVCSEELLKFTIQKAIEAGKDILLNNLPDYRDEELAQLYQQAKLNDVRIQHNHLLCFDEQYASLSQALLAHKGNETGLLRLSAHRIIEQTDRLPFNTLHGIISEKASLLLTMLPHFSFHHASVQFSHPFTKMTDDDVLMINLRADNGFLVSLELFFNTGIISDKLSLKQQTHSFQLENQLTKDLSRTDQSDDAVIRQLDQFILNLHSEKSALDPKHLQATNQITQQILTLLKVEQFI